MLIDCVTSVSGDGVSTSNGEFVLFNKAKPLLRPLDSMTEEEAIDVFKMVSLFDLSECKFEFGENGERWINASFGGRVIDSIKFIGDNIEMMNNDGTFSAVNPIAFVMSYYLSKGFDLFSLIPNGEAIDKTKTTQNG